MDPLARLVGDVDRFAQEHWGQKPMLRPGAGRFGDLLDLDAVDHLLTTTARRPTFRLVQGGRTLPFDEYTTNVRMGGTTVGEVADVSRIGALVADGATLVLQGLQRTWPPLVRYCRDLERATSHPAQANAYLTPAGASGLGRHADGHDVFVVQLHGTKAWDVEGLGTVELASGDVAYLPKGTVHAAEAQSKASLHLTIGLLRATYADVVRRVVDDLGALGDPLPLGFARPGPGRAKFAAGIRAALAATARELGAVDADDIGRSEARRAATRRHPLLDGHLRSVLSLVEIDDSTIVRHRPDNPAEVQLSGEGDHVVVRLTDRTLTMPAHAGPAIEALLSRESMPVGDLPGLDAAGRATLARRLVREGFLTLDPPGSA